MNTVVPKSSAALSGAQERKVVLLLCCFAAAHVFIFSAAFPPINNVDEQAHLDLAVKYSHGHLPRRMEPASSEAMDYIAIYGSQEFLWPPETFPDGRFPPPPWTQPMDKVAPVILAREAKWQDVNHESSQPPLYYALAGFWWKVGQWLGFGEGRLFYWLRFLNVPLLAVLVWLAYAAGRRIFPENLFMRLGPPALLAFLPQTAFYSINNDLLAPLAFGAAFIGLIRVWQTGIPDARLGAATGLALAAAWLAKTSTLPLLVASLVLVALKIQRLARTGNLRASLPALTGMVLCASLPAAAWAAWCKIHFGDFTGSAEKIQILGWTSKPFSEWWSHPVFTPHGAWTFLSGLLGSFWQGEFLWHGRPLTSPTLGAIFTVASIGFVAAAATFLVVRRTEAATLPRLALWFGLANFAASVAFLAFLSVIYDFHNCVNPSHAHPYFTSGRLLLGGLIPFLLLFVFGLDRALARFGNRAKSTALAGILLLLLISEIAADWPVFASQYNWFHM